MAIKSVNPFTGKLIRSYTEFSDKKIREVIDAAHKDFLDWRQVSFKQRAVLMKKAAAVLRKNKKKYAELMADEMGKVIRDGIAEAEKCAWVCEHYADNAEKFLKDEMVKTDAAKSYIAFQPLGVVLAVMPWNFPFWQVFRFAAPALMAGNAGLLKHASNVPGCALAIEEIFRLAGFPKNIFRALLVGSDKVDRIIENKKVMAVTLTGSLAAGQSVAKKAGECIKKTVLELGGSDPYIILEDADLDLAISTCAASRLINAGQSCIAAKRFIVVEKIYDEFVVRFIRKMRAAKMGDPYKEGVAIGPQASVKLRDQLHKQVEQSVKRGAKLLLGGKIPAGKAAFYPPTVLTNIKPGMPAYEEELFGPVAAIIKVKNEKEAVQMANDSVFGLGSAIFTKNKKRAEKLARQIEAGNCFINVLVKSDPRLPFGGIKESGYGRELSSFGIREFVNIKTVYIK